ncbi:MAG: hypothetical protein ACREFC_14605 [Stellaceae bacterium]
MRRSAEYLIVASLAVPLAMVAACAQISSVAGTVATDAPQVADAIATICNNLVPAAEATVNALAKGGAAATIQADEAKYVTPACIAAKTAATAIDGGWLAKVVAGMVSTAAGSQTAAAPAAQDGGP